MTKSELHKYGKERVAEVLCERGFTCELPKSRGLTSVTRPKANRVVLIEVKSSTKQRYLTKLFQKYKSESDRLPDFWILFSPAIALKAEQFYVVPRAEIIRLQKLRNGLDPSASFEDCVEKSSGGVDNLLVSAVDKFEGRWDLLTDAFASEH